MNAAPIASHVGSTLSILARTYLSYLGRKTNAREGNELGTSTVPMRKDRPSLEVVVKGGKGDRSRRVVKVVPLSAEAHV